MPARPVPDPDQVLDVMATTRAVRRYCDEPVPEADLARIVFAATRAPSGSNAQPFRFVVLRDSDTALAAKGLIGRAARELWSAKRRSDGYDRGSGTDPARGRAAPRPRCSTSSTSSSRSRW